MLEAYKLTKVEIKLELQGIMRDAFDDDNLVIVDETNADDVEAWNSLSHINLILAVESNFGIKFRTIEIENMTNVRDLVDAIERKI